MTELSKLRAALKSVKGAVVKTSGDGYWSDRKLDVRIRRASAHESPGSERLELDPELFIHVFFDKRTWNPEIDGLIYTDREWIAGFRELMRKAGYARASEIDYTEQGMQTGEYVHLIVGEW